MIIYISSKLNSKNNGGASTSGYELLQMLLINNSNVYTITDQQFKVEDTVFYENKINDIKKNFIIKRTNKFYGFSFYNIARYFAKHILDIFKSSNVKIKKILSDTDKHMYIIVNSFEHMIQKTDFDKLDKSNSTKICVVRGCPTCFFDTTGNYNESLMHDGMDFLNKFDHLIFVSDICREQWSEYINQDIKTYYLPNSINEIEVKKIKKLDKEDLHAKLNFSKDNINIVLVGSVQPRKGQDMLIEILEDMKALNKNIKIHMVGGISKHNRGDLIYERFMKSKASDIVVFHGFKSNAMEYIYMSDICIFTSRSEAFPRTILEYMVFKKPIVSTNVSGVPEMITHSENGLLCDADDSKQFFKNLKLLVDDLELQNNLANKANETYSQIFSKEDQISNALNIFEEIGIK
jgi:glycosyltransferase involved in cell wall biosynthesis